MFLSGQRVDDAVGSPIQTHFLILIDRFIYSSTEKISSLEAFFSVTSFISSWLNQPSIALNNIVIYHTIHTAGYSFAKRKVKWEIYSIFHWISYIRRSDNFWFW